MPFWTYLLQQLNHARLTLRLSPTPPLVLQPPRDDQKPLFVLRRR